MSQQKMTPERRVIIANRIEETQKIVDLVHSQTDREQDLIDSIKMLLGTCNELLAMIPVVLPGEEN